MADISNYIRLIELAARGEEVRDALVDSLTAMNDGIPDTVEALLTEANARGDFIGPQGPQGPQGPKGDPPELTYDEVPTQNSTNLLTSGTVYSALESITPGVSLTQSEYLLLPETKKYNGTVYYLTDTHVIYRNGVPYGQTLPWVNITSKPSTLAGYGIATDAAPTENSTNPVTSGGIYNAFQGKENTSNKKTEITAASTDIDYPSAKAVWDLFSVSSGEIYNAVMAKENASNKKTEITAASTDTDYPSSKAVWNLFFSMQAEITRLQARVAALENGENTQAAVVQNNILEVYDGEMNGTLLELGGAYVDEDNILNFGTSPSSGLTVSNNILEAGNGTMNGTVLELDGASVDDGNNLWEGG